MSSSSFAREDRMATDRRRRRTPIFSRYWLRGRRRGGRRTGERVGIYVDRYTIGELALFSGILLLSLADLLLTIVHVDAGGAEVNPLMKWALAAGGTAGIATLKLGSTAFGAIVLLLHIRFRAIRGVLFALVSMYAILMVWHGVVAADRSWLGS